MDQVKIQSETLLIVSTVMQINGLRADKVLHVTVGAGVVSITGFDCHNKAEFQREAYEWSRQQAYLPTLRKIRHDLEQMRDEALVGRGERAA